MALWAFMGIESAAVAAGNIENPKRNIPIATLAGLGISAVVYILCSTVIMGIIPNAELQKSAAPFAVAAGIAFTVHVTLLVQWVGRRTLVPTRVLFEAGQISGAILLLYLYMRFWDTTAGNYGYIPGRTEAFSMLSAKNYALSFWSWEIILGGLVAAILLIRARFRQSILLLIVGSGLAIAGLVANRWHTTFLAFTQPLTDNPPVTDPLVTPYTPAWTEWAAVMGILALLALLFSLGMRFLPAFRGTPHQDVVSSSESRILYPEYRRELSEDAPHS